ncbi:MAG: amidohydrolase [Candidatus Tectomicrobia bacterium]|nr:amidohydrolase [Candidatus Tectomicrobia bacterium]
MAGGDDRFQAKILEAPYIVTMDGQRRVLKGGALLVRGNAISALGSRRELQALAPDAELLSFDRHALLPGFIDGHEHATQMLGRGLADDVDEVKVRWGWDRIYPWEAVLEEEDVYTGALLTAVELVRNGVTCFADPGGFLMEPVARAVAESGIRAVLSVGGLDTWSEGFPLPASFLRGDPTDWALGASERLIESWHGAEGDRIRCGYSIRVLMNASEAFVREVGRRARERGLTVQIHLAVSPGRVKWVMEKTGRRPVEYLESLGILGPNWLLTHLGWVDESEIPILKARDVKVCHSPGSSMHNARGAVSRGKFPELAAQGVTLCLGNDAAACNNSLDMFRAMYLTCLGHKEARLRPDLFPPETVLEMATLGGAKALLWEDAVGSLEPGKRADVIAVDLHRPNLSPVYDFSLIPNLVYSGDGADVAFVMVDGKVLMRERRILFTDERALLSRAQAIGERLLEKVPFRIEPRWRFQTVNGG